MAPARPYWKGYLKLSLVSCPIALYTGSSSTERVSFRQINKQDRQPAAPAAGRRGHARAGRGRRQGARLRVRQERLHPGGR